MAGLLAGQGDQRHAVAAEEPKKSRKRRPSDGDDNPDDEQEKLGKGSFYKCRFCDQRFQKSQALGGHMNKHRQEREEETLHKAQALISDKQHQHMTTQGYMNMSRYGQLSATEIAQRSSALSGMQARGPQSYGMPVTAAYYPSTATGLVHPNMSTQHFNPMMSSNSSTNHVQQNLAINPMMLTNSSNNHVQQNPSNAQPWNIDNTMSSNHGPRVASAFSNEPTTNLYHHHGATNEMIHILDDSSPSSPPIHQSYHSSV